MFPKIDEVRTTLLSKNFDIFSCCETWLHEDIDDTLLQVCGYTLFRYDRRNRIGGGCAAWVRDSIICKQHDVDPPIDIECLFLTLTQLHIILIVVYLPPEIAIRHSNAIDDFIINEVDKFLETDAHLDVILCGDLNRYRTSTICVNLNLVNINRKPTYGQAELDYILFSDTLSDSYDVSIQAPLDISSVPHASLVARPSKHYSFQEGIFRKVYDLRQSHIDTFVSHLGRIDWDFVLETDITLDDKCELFQSILCFMADTLIPVSYTKHTARDKPWITPLVKSLINSRWVAFRLGHMTTYNHLKLKVRREIEKAKIAWTKRAANKNIWSAVNSNTGTRIMRIQLTSFWENLKPSMKQ